MSATIIQFPTGRVISEEPAPMTWEEAVTEMHALLEDAYEVVRSERAARDLVAVDALLDGLAEAIAAVA